VLQICKLAYKKKLNISSVTASNTYILELRNMARLHWGGGGWQMPFGGNMKMGELKRKRTERRKKKFRKDEGEHGHRKGKMKVKTSKFC
jgi:hypothetical protein